MAGGNYCSWKFDLSVIYEGEKQQKLSKLRFFQNWNTEKSEAEISAKKGLIFYIFIEILYLISLKYIAK